jgi:hypothetical protein
MKSTVRFLIAIQLVLAVTIVAAGHATAGPKPAGGVRTLSGTDLGSGR